MMTKCLLRRGRAQIPAKESHILWALCAGRCAFPGCDNKCIDSFENSGSILLGEMAHVLAVSPAGPRAKKGTGRDLNRYENLVLLCPYHHAMVDKAPLDFPSSL